jgi:hypothetical protein
MFLLKSQSCKQSFDQLMSEFEVAVANECSIDDHYRRVYGLSNELYEGLPRPAKWVGFARSNPNVVFLVFQIFKLLWVFGGGALYFFMQMSLYLCKSFFLPGRYSQRLIYDEVALGFSRRAMDVIGQASIGREASCWVLFPWVQKKDFTEVQHVVNILGLVDLKDFINSLFLSIKALYTVGFRDEGSGARRRVLSTYIAFQWFLARFALAKLNARVYVMAEHHDRWAVLADFLVRAKLSSGASLSVVQHGVESSLKSTHRLKNVSRLYVYDGASLEAFKYNILDMGAIGERLEVCFYTPHISLSDLDVKKFPHKLTVLFVGHPSSEALHVSIYERFLKGGEVNVIYKPHPTVRENRGLHKLGWVVWGNKEEFPRVDLLISYPSTLVEEYRAVGISAAVHPYALAIDDAGDYLTGLSDILENIFIEAKRGVKND